MAPAGAGTAGATLDGIALTRQRFEELVADALDSLPEGLARAMDNVAVVVEDGDDGRLLGLYHGVPLTGRWGYAGAVPDRITIYQDPICARCRTEEEVAEQVRRTVVHEVGHHFGIGDARLRELGW
ncbi:MAG: metallopeptidase family protein [Acidimicrobiales bacterium]